MKNIKFYTLFFFVFTVHAAFCLAKFQNNRFSKIEAVPAKIYSTDVYMVFGDFTEEEYAQLSKIFTSIDYQYINNESKGNTRIVKLKPLR